jgi:hypothetical protein
MSKYNAGFIYLDGEQTTIKETGTTTIFSS